jgi:hypothetical protein
LDAIYYPQPFLEPDEKPKSGIIKNKTYEETMTEYRDTSLYYMIPKVKTNEKLLSLLAESSNEFVRTTVASEENCPQKTKALIALLKKPIEVKFPQQSPPLFSRMDVWRYLDYENKILSENSLAMVFIDSGIRQKLEARRDM